MIDKKTGASPFETMLEEHRELMQQIHELRQHWAEVDEKGGPQEDVLGQRLREFRNHLAEHFEDEERDGYLAAALAVAPRFSREADELCAQHRYFLDQLDRVLAQIMSAASGGESWQACRRLFDEVVTELRRHEGAENAIVQAAFGDDVGTAD